MKPIKMNCKPLAAALALLLTAACAAGPATEAPEEAPPSAAEEAAPTITPDPGADQKHQTQVFAMDTVMLLTAYGSLGEEALAAAEARIYELEADLDPESETGSVHALNAGAGAAVPVSRDCFDVMSTAMEVWAVSGGALDPGLYPLSKAWGFIDGSFRVPAGEEIDALLAGKDTAGIRLDEGAVTAFVPAGMEVSFGAVGKGYAAQAVCDLLADRGVESAVLSLGGNVQTLGEAKPDGSLWQVAVTDPRDPGSYVGILSVGQAAVVTSGGYQRFFEQDGVTYIHILDPETGYPVENDLLSVTVVTEDGAEADALSTALFVMGLDGALALYRERGDFEMVLITDEDRVLITPGLGDAFAEQGRGYTYEYLE